MPYIPESEEQPLSRTPAKHKISAGLFFGLLNLYLAHLDEDDKLLFMAGVFLLGYAFIGLIELLLGVRLISAAKNWDKLPSWQRFIISVVVICSALVMFIFFIPVVAKI